MFERFRKGAICGLCWGLLFFTTTIFGHGFPAGTLVNTTSGSVPIESIKVGDKVVCHDEGVGFFARPVVENTQRTATNVLEICVGKTSFLADPEHQFYLPLEKTWVIAEKLKIGDYLLQNGGKKIAINAIKKVEKRVAVYDLSVEEFHNFQVSRKKIVAHNFVPLIVSVAGSEAVPVVGAALVAAKTGIAAAVAWGVRTLFGAWWGGDSKSEIPSAQALIESSEYLEKIKPASLYERVYETSDQERQEQIKNMDRCEQTINYTKTACCENLPPKPRRKSHRHEEIMRAHINQQHNAKKSEEKPTMAKIVKAMACSAGGDPNDPKKNNWGKNSHEGDIDKNDKLPAREIVHEKVKSVQQAQRIADLERGPIDRSTATPVVGKLGDNAGCICGISYNNGKAVTRLDWDEIKGPHINLVVEKNGAWSHHAFPFVGDQKTIISLTKPLNTDGNVNWAFGKLNNSNDKMAPTYLSRLKTHNPLKGK